eukprot:12416524-Karenia_brevis.AAC.1
MCLMVGLGTEGHGDVQPAPPPPIHRAQGHQAKEKGGILATTEPPSLATRPDEPQRHVPDGWVGGA